MAADHVAVLGERVQMALREAGLDLVVEATGGIVHARRPGSDSLGNYSDGERAMVERAYDVCRVPDLARCSCCGLVPE